MAAILVSSFSAGATIKRCPTAFSYGNIDIDLSNLQNIICQKSLIKNSSMSNFLNIRVFFIHLKRKKFQFQTQRLIPM